MAKKIEISEKEYKEVLKAIKNNKHKRIDKKLQVIKLRYEGLTLSEISNNLSISTRTVTKMISAFKSEGIEDFVKLKYGGNHRSLIEEEENEILKSFEDKMDKGEIVTVKEIKKAFDEKIGKDTGRGYIYMVLKRKGFRKVMPRSKHPKKASEEVIKASKKLTIIQEKSC